MKKVLFLALVISMVILGGCKGRDSKTLPPKSIEEITFEEIEQITDKKATQEQKGEVIEKGNNLQNSTQMEKDAVVEEMTQSTSTLLSEMVGKYEYASECAGNDTGILEISPNTEYNIVDITDWECGEDGLIYRFVANSSNIESESDNKIYLKYPQMVYEDGYEVFSYYILEKTELGINVYNSDISFEDAKLLYSAIKKL